MQATIKYIKLLNKNDNYGFEIGLDTEEGVKKFGSITDKLSFRRLFFGILSICNNFDISDLSKTTGEKVSTIIEYPNTLNQRIASIGSKYNFLFHNKEDRYVTKKLNYKEKKLLKMVNAMQTAKIISIKSMSGTICMLFEFAGYTQGATGPHLFVGMGYPLSHRELTDEEKEFVGNYSSTYIAGLISTILNTKYLYHEKKNKDVYQVECVLDELGNVVSIGNQSTIENREIPVYINNYDNEYHLEATPKLEINKKLTR